MVVYVTCSCWVGSCRYSSCILRCASHLTPPPCSTLHCLTSHSQERGKRVLQFTSIHMHSLHKVCERHRTVKARPSLRRPGIISSLLKNTSPHKRPSSMPQSCVYYKPADDVLSTMHAPPSSSESDSSMIKGKPNRSQSSRPSSPSSCAFVPPSPLASRPHASSSSPSPSSPPHYSPPPPAS